MLDIKQFSSDLIDSYLDILTFDEKLLVFKEIKIIFTRLADLLCRFPLTTFSKKKINSKKKFKKKINFKKKI
jgi:hypothetical protein